MNAPNSIRPETVADQEAPSSDDHPAPLPGEVGIPSVAAARRQPLSRKGVMAAAVLLASIVLVAGFSLQRSLASGAAPSRPDRTAERPAAAAGEARKLDLSAAASSPKASVRVPAIVPTSEELAEPIGVRRTGAVAPQAQAGTSALPEDAPVMLVTSRAATPSGPGAQRPAGYPQVHPPQDASAPNDTLSATARDLQDYQRQLQGLLDSLMRGTAQATGGIGQAAGPQATSALVGSSLPAVGATGGLFGGQLPSSTTPRASAALLGNRSLTLPKGTAFTCALKTKVVTATSGLVGCLVQRHVYGDDGRVLLIERGSHIDGEYRATSLRPGTVRIPVLWTRIRTPLGVTVDIDSPGTGALGESGVDGHVDNRWSERIGAAMLLSLIDDSVKLIIQNQRDTEGGGDTVVLPSTTSNTSRLAEKVLDSTINIPPLIYQNQGGVVGIYVARDVDFSSVYELQAVAR